MSEPAEPREFQLRWNNHKENLLNSIFSSADEQSFTDVKLSCNGGDLFAHRLVLGTCSEFLLDLFNLQTGSESKSHQCIQTHLIFEAIPVQDMSRLLAIIYKGESRIPHNEINNVLNLAKSLKIKGFDENSWETIPSSPKESSLSNEPKPMLKVLSEEDLKPSVSEQSVVAAEASRFGSPSADNFPTSSTPLSLRAKSPLLRQHIEPIIESPEEVKESLQSPHFNPNMLIPTTVFAHNYSPRLDPLLSNHADWKQHSPALSLASALPMSFVKNLTEHSKSRIDSLTEVSNTNSTDTAPLDLKTFPNAPDFLRSRANSPDPSPLRNPLSAFGNYHPHISKTPPYTARNTPSYELPLPHNAPPYPLLDLGYSFNHLKPHNQAIFSDFIAKRRLDEVHELNYSMKKEQKVEDDYVKESDYKIPSGQFPPSVSTNSSAEQDREGTSPQSASALFNAISNFKLNSEKVNDSTIATSSATSAPSSSKPNTNGSKSSTQYNSSSFVNYMPAANKEWKRYKQYSKADLASAIEAVKAGTTALQASRKYRVPSRTLYDKIKKLGIATTTRKATALTAPRRSGPSIHGDTNHNMERMQLGEESYNFYENSNSRPHSVDSATTNESLNPMDLQVPKSSAAGAINASLPTNSNQILQLYSNFANYQRNRLPIDSISQLRIESEMSAAEQDLPSPPKSLHPFIQNSLRNNEDLESSQSRLQYIEKLKLLSQRTINNDVYNSLPYSHHQSIRQDQDMDVVVDNDEKKIPTSSPKQTDRETQIKKVNNSPHEQNDTAYGSHSTNNNSSTTISPISSYNSSYNGSNTPKTPDSEEKTMNLKKVNYNNSLQSNTDRKPTEENKAANEVLELSKIHFNGREEKSSDASYKVVTDVGICSQLRPLDLRETMSIQQQQSV